MQPGVAGGLGSERHQRVVRVLGPAAAEAAIGRRAHRIAVEPFGDAAREGAGFGLFARQPAVELGDARPFVEEGPPVFARPAVAPRVKTRGPSDRQRPVALKSRPGVEIAGRHAIGRQRRPLLDGVEIDRAAIERSS